MGKRVVFLQIRILATSYLVKWGRLLNATSLSSLGRNILNSLPFKNDNKSPTGLLTHTHTHTQERMLGSSKTHSPLLSLVSKYTLYNWSSTSACGLGQGILSRPCVLGQGLRQRPRGGCRPKGLALPEEGDGRGRGSGLHRRSPPQRAGHGQAFIGHPA